MRSESISTQEVPYNFIFVCVGLFALGLAFSIFNLFIVGMPSEASLVKELRSNYDGFPQVVGWDMDSLNQAAPHLPAELAEGKVFKIEAPEQNSFIAVYIDETRYGIATFERSFSGWHNTGSSLSRFNTLKQGETLVVGSVSTLAPSYDGILGWRTNSEAQKVRLRYQDLSQSIHPIEEESFVVGDFGEQRVCAIEVLNANDELIEQLELTSTACSES